MHMSAELAKGDSHTLYVLRVPLTRQELSSKPWLEQLKVTNPCNKLMTLPELARLSFSGVIWLVAGVGHLLLVQPWLAAQLLPRQSYREYI